MGAQQSASISSCDDKPSNISATLTSSVEDVPGATVSPSSFNPNSTAPVVPKVPGGTPMPQLMRPETFEEKLYRKFKAEPLVPIGCLTTAYFLASGIRSFYNRDPVKSQTMMRLRVGSQFATIMIFVGYAGWNSFTFDFAPGMAVPSEQFPIKSRGNSGEDEK
ncbi:hypothetical protein ACHAWX_006019 [Stephanocyclus meneghinianus]